jgi:hypothetical protein
MDSECVVILGMHRSGTSALAGVLQQLGVDFGNDLVGATPANPKGHFELTAAVRMNDHLLRRVFGARWKTPFHLPTRWRDAVDLKALATEYQLELPAGNPCGLKDPRICRLVPVWKELLEARGLRASFILMLRRPDEVSASLAARDGLSPKDARALWVEHVCAAERATRDSNRTLVTYEALLQDTNAVVKRLGEFLKLPAISVEKRSAISEFLDRELRHHVHENGASREAFDLADRLYSSSRNFDEGEMSAIVDAGLADSRRS